MKNIILLIVSVFILASCHTVPVALDTLKTDKLFVDVIDTQSKVVDTGNEVASTIDKVKDITDDAKTTGEIPKEKVVTLIKYVDQSSEQMKAHNATVTDLTSKITALERSRISDNEDASKVIASKQNEIDKEKIKASIFFKWALIATGIALFLACVIVLPKLVRLG